MEWWGDSPALAAASTKTTGQRRLMKAGGPSTAHTLRLPAAAPLLTLHWLAGYALLRCCRRAGGAGITLTAGTHIILCEPSLNPSFERQAIGRSHRMGQTKPITVTRLRMKGAVRGVLCFRRTCGWKCVWAGCIDLRLYLPTLPTHTTHTLHSPELSIPAPPPPPRHCGAAGSAAGSIEEKIARFVKLQGEEEEEAQDEEQPPSTAMEANPGGWGWWGWWGGAWWLVDALFALVSWCRCSPLLLVPLLPPLTCNSDLQPCLPRLPSPPPVRPPCCTAASNDATNKLSLEDLHGMLYIGANEDDE